MEEQGIIMEIKGAAAVVKAERSAGCEKCITKDVCHPQDDNSMMIEVDNPIGAKVGEKVVFTIGAATVLKAGVLVYLFPLLAFIAGVVVGQVAGESVLPGYDKDLVSTVLGFLFLAGAFGGLKLYSRRAEEGGAYRPCIVRVIK